MTVSIHKICGQVNTALCNVRCTQHWLYPRCLYAKLQVLITDGRANVSLADSGESTKHSSTSGWALWLVQGRCSTGTECRTVPNMNMSCACWTSSCSSLSNIQEASWWSWQKYSICATSGTMQRHMRCKKSQHDGILKHIPCWVSSFRKQTDGKCLVHSLAWRWC